MAKQQRRDALCVEVLAALGSGRVVAETWLEDYTGRLLDGCVDPDTPTVRINEASVIVKVLLHELVHKVRPAWCEHAVTSWTGRLFNQLTHAEIERIYDIYLGRVARTRKRAI